MLMELLESNKVHKLRASLYRMVQEGCNNGTCDQPRGHPEGAEGGVLPTARLDIQLWERGKKGVNDICLMLIDHLDVH